MARGHHSEHDERRKVTRAHHLLRLEDLDSAGFASNIYGEPMHLDPRSDSGRNERNNEWEPYSTSYDEFEEPESRDWVEDPYRHGRGLA